MHMQRCYFVELRTLMCGVTSPLLLKKIYQISPWNKNLVSSHTYIYKGKIIDSSDLSIIFSLLLLLLFCFVNILYRKINLQVYIYQISFILNIRTKKNQHELCIFISYQYLFPYFFRRRRVCGGLLGCFIIIYNKP